MKTQRTKAKQHSIGRLQQAVALIEEIVPQERKRSSFQRRRWLESAYEVFFVHCRKLGIEVPYLSHGYDPEQYAKNAQIIKDHLAEMAGSLSMETQKGTVVSSNQFQSYTNSQQAKKGQEPCKPR